MKKILGISAYFHDSSACLLIGGTIVAAIPEERLSRSKHDASFPEKAIAFCLETAGVNVNELDEVVFFEKPFTRFERIMETFLKRAPRGFRPFRKAISGWLGEKFWIEDHFRKTFGYTGTFSYCRHHLAHAALAAGMSGYQDAAWLIIDGVGEKACTSFGVFEQGMLRPVAEQHFPHSIGLFYSACTQYCGFKVNSGEYKLMGLAPYGKPRFTGLMREHLIRITADGVVTLNTDYVGFLDDVYMINRRFEKLLGRKRRLPEEPMDDFYCDVAASAQQLLEELVIGVTKSVQHQTGKTHLVYGGGVALNCVANARLIGETGFEHVYIHPASGDSGCALGAAIWRSMEYGEWPTGDRVQDEFFGPAYTDEALLAHIHTAGLTVAPIPADALLQQVCEWLVRGKVIGWFNGASEMGPRALGNRSILADPRYPEMKRILNERIKKREGFRPFAPVVLAEHFDNWFVDAGYDYARMLYVTQARERAAELTACVHVDGSARAQRLTRSDNARLYDLLIAFYHQTGCPALINTSMNERGEPMVCSPEDAIRCFLNTEMDVLVLGNYCLLKAQNRQIQPTFTRYEPD